MTPELKRRLILTKWRGELETLRDNAEQHKKDVNELTDELDLTKSHLKDAEDDLEAAREAHVDEIRDLTETLDAVRWWMHEPLVLQMPMRDPRVMLRRIEDVLG